MNHCYAKMATSSQREGGRESAPPTPSKSSTEKKPQTADNDVQQVSGHQEHPTQPQERSSTLNQEDPQPPHVKEEEEEPQCTHIKEEEEELWITQEEECLLRPKEDDLIKLPLTVVSVKTDDQEDKPPKSLRWLCPSEVQQLIGRQGQCPPQPQGGNSTLKQEDPQPPQVKKEEEELWTTQKRECHLGLKETELTKLPLTSVSVKTEDKPLESSQLHHSGLHQGEANREVGPSSSSSPGHTTTEADGDHCGGSQADNLLAPLSDSDDTTSHSPEDEDRDNTQKHLRSDTDWEGDMKTHTNNKHSQCSKKKTDIQQLISHQEECLPQAQGWSSTLKQEDPQPPHVKEEDVESQCTHIKEEEEEPQPTHMKEEEGEPQPPHVKEEEEEVWITQDEECLLGPEEADLTKFPLTVVSVKTEDHEHKPPESSLLHHSPSEENREVELPSSSSPQHMTTEADGDHCGGSQADNLLAPLSDSDDTTSHSPEDEDRNDTQEPLSGDTDWEGDMRTQTDNKHSECSKKKTSKKCFTCSICAKTFTQKSTLTRHTQSTHNDEKPFSCAVCDKRFSLRSYMASHMTKHTAEKPFSCSVCAKSFSCKRYVTQHMLTHTVEKPFGCSVCGQGFNQKSQMVLHMTKHTGEKPFSCSVCAKSFSCKRNLSRHILTHTGEKPFSCSVCTESFSRKPYLTQHMLKHTGEKPFGCSFCGQGFIQKSQMLLHMRKHTGEKPFRCSVCGRNYAYKNNLALHMVTHNEVKPFSCSVCGKGFSKKSQMVSHMRKHTGEKPFGCSVCGSNYSNKNSLIHHMVTHTG
ncbi:oocyte zinc finger protein XlCOF22-like [Dunckerocampus dactyliophorus]|uniref:oocyte zinc finger protein XlCOF22-like n=1 Tax=Dunckerocampus dactyliophorus TaxID=161453 RepID=UPI002404CA33|nr:oocyte zinc finger protein XlCOF22-like [Dunckerocampus dactyliophorus]